MKTGILFLAMFFCGNQADAYNPAFCLDQCALQVGPYVVDQTQYKKTANEEPRLDLVRAAGKKFCDENEGMKTALKSCEAQTDPKKVGFKEGEFGPVYFSKIAEKDKDFSKKTKDIEDIFNQMGLGAYYISCAEGCLRYYTTIKGQEEKCGYDKMMGCTRKGEGFQPPESAAPAAVTSQKLPSFQAVRTCDRLCEQGCAHFDLRMRFSVCTDKLNPQIKECHEKEAVGFSAYDFCAGNGLPKPAKNLPPADRFKTRLRTLVPVQILD